MTYKEAAQIIKDNEKALDKYVTHSNPPHRVLGCIISHENSNLAIEQKIYEQVINNNRDNLDVLLEMNLVSDKLKPFVILLMRGDNIIQPLESYLSNPLLTGNEGNLS
ncbi:MAG TPA: hypothetical protein VK498_08030 [Ferruginibacter sp.]|nr:hypothetical protein [Ferruginibacter sp.]